MNHKDLHNKVSTNLVNGISEIRGMKMLDFVNLYDPLFSSHGNLNQLVSADMIANSNSDDIDFTILPSNTQVLFITTILSEPENMYLIQKRRPLIFITQKDDLLTDTNKGITTQCRDTQGNRIICVLSPESVFCSSFVSPVFVKNQIICVLSDGTMYGSAVGLPVVRQSVMKRGSCLFGI